MERRQSFPSGSTGTGSSSNPFTGDQQKMSNSKANFFSISKFLKEASAFAELEKRRPPTYDSILTCSFPERPISPESTPSTVAALSPDPQDENMHISSAPNTIGGLIGPKDSDVSKKTMSKEKLEYNLAKMIEMLSTTADKRLGDIDILEIAAMRGIHFGHPKWWRPGGYGPKKDQNLENDKVE